jgi:hypothetical protein
MPRSLIIHLLSICVLSSPLWAYSGGSGTPEDPYQIATAQDLIDLGNEPNDYDKSFILTADIDLSDQTFDRAVIGWDSDPNQSRFQGTYFSGSFNGQGFLVRNLCIQGQDYLGLFGRLLAGAMITNLGLEKVEVSGNDYIGGLVGSNYGNITSSYSTGLVSGNGSVGGLMGSAGHGNITLSYSNTTVSGNDYVGGLIGDNDGSILSCFWDTQISGLTDSEEDTGLSTAEMQDINTYLNAGWDFVDETDNGTEDIWFMPENDYPKHAWNIGSMD